MAKKIIVLSHHTRRRLTQRRQEGVTEYDIYAACHKAFQILTRGVPQELKLGGFLSKANVRFSIVVVDCEEGLKIVTVIGHKYDKRRGYAPQDAYCMHDLPYKQQIKRLRKLRKESKKWDPRKSPY